MSSSYSKKHNSAEFKLQDQPSLPEWTKPQHMHAQYGLGWECLQFKEGTNKQASNKEKQETHSPFLALTQIYCTAQVAKQNSHTECFKLCLKIESVGSSCHEKLRTVLTLHLISDLRLLKMGCNPHGPFHIVLSQQRHRHQQSHGSLPAQGRRAVQFHHSKYFFRWSGRQTQDFSHGHFPFHHSAKAAPEPGLCSKTCTWTWVGASQILRRQVPKWVAGRQLKLILDPTAQICIKGNNLLEDHWRWN